MAWLADGLPVFTGRTRVHAVTFAARPRPDIAMTTAEVAAQLDKLTLIDARSPAEFSGQRKVGLVARSGTIPGAINLPHSRFYSGTFAKPDAIRDLLVAARIPTDRRIVTFCNVGHWSALDWFALSEVAALPNVALYPGSMSAWAADPARAVQ
jgi:thiosulfate/3-mercaptopyruvate sulfurtransferase